MREIRDELGREGVRSRAIEHQDRDAFAPFDAHEAQARAPAAAGSKTNACTRESSVSSG